MTTGVLSVHWPAVWSPLFLVHAVGVVVAAAMATYALCNRDYPGVRWFAAWAAGVSLWLAVNTAGFVVRDPGTRLAFESVGFAVVPFFATTWLGFALAYTGRGRSLTRPRVVGAFVVATGFAAFVATNPVHQLVFGALEIRLVAGVVGVGDFTPYWGFWAVNGYVYLLFVAGIVLLLDLVVTGGRLYADQTAALLFGVGLPLAAAVSVFVGREPVPVDPTPLAFAIASVPLAYAVFRSSLLDFVPAFYRLGERRAIGALDQGVVVLDPSDRVVVANPAVEPILEIDRNAVRGSPFESLLDSSPLEPATRWLDEHGDGASTRDRPARDGQASVPDRLRDARNGRIYSVTQSRISADGGGALGRTLVFRDVTEERRRKQRLLVLNRVVRHNLRNDMTVLLGHARMLGAASDDESLEVIETIGSDLIDLGEKAQEIDHIIRETAADRHPVNVAGIVERVVERHRSAHPDVAFDLRVPEQAWTEAHGPVIEAIVSNLVENAVEHGTPTTDAAVVDGGTPTDSDVDDRSSHRPGVTVALERLSDRLELVVADDGPGIPEHELHTVLAGEVTDLQHASGLGLWMVKWCVDLADARWTVQTDDGTRVVVTFRRSDVERSD